MIGGAPATARKGPVGPGRDRDRVTWRKARFTIRPANGQIAGMDKNHLGVTFDGQRIFLARRQIEALDRETVRLVKWPA